jgi:hypothetical protein
MQREQIRAANTPQHPAHTLSPSKTPAAENIYVSDPISATLNQCPGEHVTHPQYTIPLV